MQLWDVSIVDSSKNNELFDLLFVLYQLNIIDAEHLHELLGLLCLILERGHGLHAVLHLPHDVSPCDQFPTMTKLLHAAPRHLMVLHAQCPVPVLWRLSFLFLSLKVLFLDIFDLLAWQCNLLFLEHNVITNVKFL